MSSVAVQSPLVTSQWLSEHLDDPAVRVIEVEGMADGTRENYEDGHVPGARFWPWQTALWDELRRDFPAPAAFAERLGQAGIRQDTTLVFYSRDPQFGVYGWWVSRYCGHEQSVVLDGGVRHWVHDGQVTQRGPAAQDAPVEYGPPRARDESMRIRRDAVLGALHQPGTVLIDARTPQEYSGAVVSPRGQGGAVRSGRIPGAVSIPYFTLLDDDGRFLPTKALEAVVAAHGISRGDRIITYCRLGHRASLMYFVLHELLGYADVQSYDGSWIEWGNLVGVPIERGELG